MELHIKKFKNLTGKGHFNQNPGVNVTEKTIDTCYVKDYLIQ